MELIKIIDSIAPEYRNSDQFINPLPNEVELQEDNEMHLIDISFKSEVLKTNIWDGEEQYHPTQEEVNYIYNYLQTSLAKEIEKTKEYYQEHNYNYIDFNN